MRGNPKIWHREPAVPGTLLSNTIIEITYKVPTKDENRASRHLKDNDTTQPMLIHKNPLRCRLINLLLPSYLLLISYQSENQERPQPQMMAIHSKKSWHNYAHVDHVHDRGSLQVPARCHGAIWSKQTQQETLRSQNLSPSHIRSVLLRLHSSYIIVSPLSLNALELDESWWCRKM